MWRVLRVVVVQLVLQHLMQVLSCSYCSWAAGMVMRLRIVAIQRLWQACSAERAGVQLQRHGHVLRRLKAWVFRLWVLRFRKGSRSPGAVVSHAQLRSPVCKLIVCHSGVEGLQGADERRVGCV